MKTQEEKYLKMDIIASKLEDKYIMDMSKEAKEILAFVQFYRIQRAWDEKQEKERCNCKQNCLPYHATIKIAKCKRCGNVI